MKASKRAAWDAAALAALLSYHLNSTWTHELANNRQDGRVRTRALRFSPEHRRDEWNGKPYMHDRYVREKTDSHYSKISPDRVIRTSI